MGRWGDGGVFIKGNYPDMILPIFIQYLEKNQDCWLT